MDLTEHHRRSRPPRAAGRGFTLVELVVVIIILAVLSVVAVPKFVALGTQARIASVTALGGAVRSAANGVYAACLVARPEALSGYNENVVIGDRLTKLQYCWPDSGDFLDTDQIDTWVLHEGFTASLPDGDHTRFSIDSAPDPANCSVTYGDTLRTGIGTVPIIGVLTSGC